MLLEVGGENLAAVPEVVTLDSRLVSLAVRSPRVNLPTKRCARRAAQIAFARRAGCSRCAYTASRAGSSHWALGTWHCRDSHPHQKTSLSFDPSNIYLVVANFTVLMKIYGHLEWTLAVVTA